MFENIISLAGKGVNVNFTNQNWWSWKKVEEMALLCWWSDFRLALGGRLGVKFKSFFRIETGWNGEMIVAATKRDEFEAKGKAASCRMKWREWSRLGVVESQGHRPLTLRKRHPDGSCKNPSSRRIDSSSDLSGRQSHRPNRKEWWCRARASCSRSMAEAVNPGGTGPRLASISLPNWAGAGHGKRQRATCTTSCQGRDAVFYKCNINSRSLIIIIFIMNYFFINK